jgi:hypothetical protein
MARSSWIQIECASRISALEALTGLLASGWSLDDHGQINMLPLGDTDQSNWTGLNLEERERAFDIIGQKEVAEEVIGITLSWPANGIGVNAHFRPDGTIWFSLLINLRTLEKSEVTDVSWYLRRIIPPLVASGARIERIGWDQTV